MFAYAVRSGRWNIARLGGVGQDPAKNTSVSTRQDMLALEALMLVRLDGTANWDSVYPGRRHEIFRLEIYTNT